jgi:DNA invertase Pin-like site-specific DNA recombinase
MKKQRQSVILGKGLIFGYVRMSKDSSDAENQKFVIVRTLGREPDEWVIETVSGTKHQDDRELGGLIARIGQGDKLYVADISRIGRTFFDSMEAGARIMRQKVEVTFCDPLFTLKDDPGSELYFTAMVLGARMQRDYISASTRRALARKKANGEAIGRPKGTTTVNQKLLAALPEIEKLLSARVSQRAIAQIYNVAPDTFRAFLRKKELTGFSAGEK